VVIVGLFELVVEAVGSFLGWLGWERFVVRDEAKPDPRNFPPPH
jgi:hypothetical protein